MWGSEKNESRKPRKEDAIVTKDILDESMEFMKKELIRMIREMEASRETIKTKNQKGKKKQTKYEKFDTSSSEDESESDDSESSNSDSESEKKKRSKKKDKAKKLKKQKFNLSLERTRQNALMQASNIKDYTQKTYKEFLKEVENIIKIYGEDKKSMQIILDTASLKIDNPLVKGKKFKDFKELKKAVTEISVTELDYVTYTNKIARAAQASDQTVEQFGDYMAELLEEQTAAYCRKKEDKMSARKLQKELKELSEIAALNFIDGISLKNKDLKMRLRMKTYDSLASVIIEAKMIGKSIDEEKSRAYAQKAEEFRLKKRNGDQKQDKKFLKKNLEYKLETKQIKTPLKCYDCDEIGHKEFDCPNEMVENPVKYEENVIILSVLAKESDDKNIINSEYIDVEPAKTKNVWKISMMAEDDDKEEKVCSEEQEEEKFSDVISENQEENSSEIEQRGSLEGELENSSEGNFEDDHEEWINARGDLSLVDAIQQKDSYNIEKDTVLVNEMRSPENLSDSIDEAVDKEENIGESDMRLTELEVIKLELIKQQSSRESEEQNNSVKLLKIGNEKLDNRIMKIYNYLKGFEKQIKENKMEDMRWESRVAYDVSAIRKRKPPDKTIIEKWINEKLDIIGKIILLICLIAVDLTCCIVDYSWLVKVEY